MCPRLFASLPLLVIWSGLAISHFLSEDLAACYLSEVVAEPDFLGKE